MPSQSSHALLTLTLALGALTLAACGEAGVSPTQNSGDASAVFARNPASKPGNPDGNKSCEPEQGTKARKSPGEKNQCGDGGDGGGSTFTRASNGVTILCPTAAVGDTGVVNWGAPCN